MSSSMNLPEQLQSYIRFDRDAQLLLCFHCRNALLPSSIEYHLRTKVHTSKAIIKEASNFATLLPQYTKDTVPLRADYTIAIPDLPIYDGFQCRQCSFRSRHKPRVFDHAAKEHNLRKAPIEQRLQAVRMQSWFSDNRARYWLVRERESRGVVEREVENPENSLIEKERLRVEKEEKQREIVREIEGQDDTDWWLKRTGWQELFAGRNLLVLSKTTALPSTDEPHLLLICEAFDRIIQRCLQTLKRTSRQVLCWLHSAKADSPHMRPFTVPEAKDTLTKYCRHWKSFLTYLFRTLEIEEEIRSQEHGIRYSQQTEQYATTVLLLAKELLDEEILAQERTAQLNKLSHRLMQLCIDILRHRYRTGDIYENPLLFFTAVLGIDQQKLTFRRPETYTSYLAGLTWINRLLLLEFALPQHTWTGLEGLDWPDRTVYEDYGHRIREVHAIHLAVGSFSPQSEILSLLAYGMRVAKEQGSRTVITWSSDGQTAWFDGSPIRIESLREFCKATVGKAESVLYDTLMFSHREVLDLFTIHDSVTYNKAGHWFGVLPINNCKYGAEYLMPHAKRCSDRHRLFRTVQRSSTTELEWQDSHRKAYIKAERQFLEFLLVLVHCTGGQPARTTEIGTIKYRNTGAMQRNIFILEGQIAVITEYDKARHKRVRTRYICRFLPTAVTNILVNYLVFARPFCEMVRHSIASNTTADIPNDYLFGSLEDSWTGRKISEVLRRETALSLGVGLGFAKWRQFSKGVAKKHLIEVTKEMERYEQEGGDSNESGSDKEEELVNIIHVQAAHTSTIGIQRYGLDSGFLEQLQPELISAMRWASIRWHEFLQLDTVGSQVGKRKRTRAKSIIDATVQRSSKASRRENRSYSVSAGYLQTQITKALIRLYGPEGGFRSERQEQACKAVLRNQSTLLVVMGTAEGKSLLFQLSAMLRQAGTVLVIVPFRALIENLVVRSLKQGIDTVEWSSRLTHPHALVIVSADMAITNAFMQYASTLANDGLLMHMFVDECHIAFMDIDYRKTLQELGRMRDFEVAVPLTLMSATVPPIMEEYLFKSLLLKSSEVTIVRFPTARSNIVYRIRTSEPGKITSNTISRCQRYTAAMTKDKNKGIIYCRSKKTCLTIAKELDCPIYIADSSDKAKSLERWQEDTGCWITATSALGTGVDLGKINEVLHADRPYGLIDYVQQSGRGGRDGKSHRSTIIADAYTTNWEARKPQDITNEVRLIDEEWLQKYLTTKDCRRIIIGEYMDGVGLSCKEINGLPCDNCEIKLVELPRYRIEVARDESIRQVTIEILNDLQQLCLYCLVCETQAVESHKFYECLQSSAGYRHLTYPMYRQWRREIQLEEYEYCYHCGLPQNYCDRNDPDSETIECRWIDVPLVLCFLGIDMGEIQASMHQFFGVSFRTDKEVMKWITGEQLYESKTVPRILLILRIFGKMLLERFTEKRYPVLE